MTGLLKCLAPSHGTTACAVAEALSTWTVGTALLSSGLAHWSNPYYFLGTIYSYGIVTSRIAEIVALVLPTLMLIVALCAICDIYKEGALWVALFGFATFGAVQVSAWVRNASIECGCFGPSYGQGRVGLLSLTIVVCLFVLTAASIGMRTRKLA
jgi:hypothetical protein